MDEEDASAIAELYVPDGPVRGLGKRPMLQPRDFEAFQKALLGLVKDVHVAIDRSLEDGEWLSLLCTLSAKCRKTGKPVDITGTCFVRIVDGTAREAYNTGISSTSTSSSASCRPIPSAGPSVANALESEPGRP